MTSKRIALRALDAIFIAFTTALLLAVGILPMDWLLNLIDIALLEFPVFAALLIPASLWLIYLIAADSREVHRRGKK